MRISWGQQSFLDPADDAIVERTSCAFEESFASPTIGLHDIVKEMRNQHQRLFLVGSTFIIILGSVHCPQLLECSKLSTMTD